MKEWHCIIVDKSFSDSSVINSLKILGQRKSASENWILYKIGIGHGKLQETISMLQRKMKPGFYFHLYSGKRLIVVFKEKAFELKTNKFDWKEAIEYGRRQGIPERQLDFYPCKTEEENY